MVEPARYFRDSYEFKIWGLSAKSGALAGAQTTVNGMIESRRQLANAVLETAFGPWAHDFREKEQRLLSAMANAWFYLGYCADACARFPAASYYGGSPTSIGTAIASRTELAEPGGDGTVAADLGALSAYITEAQGQHDTGLAGVYVEVDIEGLWGNKTYYSLFQPSFPSLLPPPTTAGPTLGPTGPPFVPPPTVLTPGELSAALPFLSHEPTGLITLSSDVLAFANDRKAALERAGDGDGDTGGGGRPGDGGVGWPGSDVAPTVPTAPPASEVQPPAGDLPELQALQALTVVAGGFATIDRPVAGEAPSPGRLTRLELAAAAADTTLPADVRAAAALLAADPELFAAVAVVHQPLVADPDGRLQHVTVDDIATFLGGVDAVAALQAHIAAVDLPGPDGVADGIVSPDELRAAASDPLLDAEARDAAAFLLDNPVVTQRLAHYGALFPGDGAPVDPDSLLLPPIVDPATGDPVLDPDTGHPQFEVASFSTVDLARMAADQRELLGTNEESAPPAAGASLTSMPGVTPFEGRHLSVA